MTNTPHIGKHGYTPGQLGYEFDCELSDCTYHYRGLDSRYAEANGVLEIVPPEGKAAHLRIGRLIEAATDMLAALKAIEDCALKSPQALLSVIHNVGRAAIAKATD